MNYTYEQFENEAKAKGLYNTMSAADLNLAKMNPDAGMAILQAKIDYNNAKTDEQRALAHTAAEEIRKTYGNYSGGIDGRAQTSLASALPPVDKGGDSTQTAIGAGGGKIDYGDAGISQSQSSLLKPPTTYQPKYTEQIDKLASGLTNEYAGYNPENDELFSAYKKQYLREAKRASEDVLGQYAANTGGLASTAAVTAASQAYDYFVTQLADKIPELAEMDYNKWYTNQTLLIQKLAAMNELETTNYQIYAAERNAAQSYAELMASYGDYSGLKALGIDTSSAEYERALANALTIADVTGDTSYLAALGIDTSILDARFADESYARKLELAIQAAAAGDTSLMTALGLDPTYYNMKLQNNLKLEEQQIAANQQDYELRQRAYEDSQRQQAYENAMSRWTALGYADQVVADVLGVPVGTKTNDAAYGEKYLELYGRNLKTEEQSSTPARNGITYEQFALAYKKYTDRNDRSAETIATLETYFGMPIEDIIILYDLPPLKSTTTPTTSNKILTKKVGYGGGIGEAPHRVVE